MSEGSPNILVIVTHDSGRQFGCYGSGRPSPAIDAMAGDGVRFTRMFATAPICSPSRGSLFTGQCPQRNGMMGLAGGQWAWELNDYTKHLSHVTRAAGYSTHLFGHQHDTDFVERLGFDQLHEYLSPHDRNPVKTAPFIARSFADFCRTRNPSKPFYAQMSFFETHTPYDFGGALADDLQAVNVPDWVGRDDAEVRQRVAGLQGAAKRVDEAVGIVHQALRENGLEQDTLVLFTTDHGPEYPRGKWTLLDGGLGIAFILRWPGGRLTGGRTCDLLLSNTDFVPTLCELTGLRPAHPFDGHSFAAAARGESTVEVREEVHGIYVDLDYSVRTDRYKLIRRFKGERPEGRPVDTDGRPVLTPAAQLFDLKKDPNEFTNVAGQPAYQNALEEMNRRLWRWLESVDDPILRGPVPTPFYQKAIQDYQNWRRKS